MIETLNLTFFIGKQDVMDFKRKNKSQTDGIVVEIEPGVAQLRVSLTTTIPPI